VNPIEGIRDIACLIRLNWPDEVPDYVEVGQVFALIYCFLYVVFSKVALASGVSVAHDADWLALAHC